MSSRSGSLILWSTSIRRILFIIVPRSVLFWVVHLLNRAITLPLKTSSVAAVCRKSFVGPCGTCWVSWEWNRCWCQILGDLNTNILGSCSLSLHGACWSVVVCNESSFLKSTTISLASSGLDYCPHTILSASPLHPGILLELVEIMAFLRLYDVALYSDITGHDSLIVCSSEGFQSLSYRFLWTMVSD